MLALHSCVFQWRGRGRFRRGDVRYGIRLADFRKKNLNYRYVRFISRNQGSFCWFLLNSSLCTLYWRPSSSRVIEILWPLGAIRWEKLATVSA
jgi:hypothetical protein